MRSLGRIVLHLLVFALALETAVRVEDWVRFRTPLLSRFRSIEDLAVRDADGMHGRSNARFQKWVMNDVGTRGPDVPTAKSLGTYRVVTAGASETFGLYESSEREYPRQLEDTLRAHRGKCGAPVFEVLNAAFPGMSVPTITQDVRRRIVRLAPDAVLLYPTPTQYLFEDRPMPAAADTSGRYLALPAANAYHPRVVDRLRDQVKALAPGPVLDWVRARYIAGIASAHGASWRFTEVPIDRLDAYELDLRAYVGAVRAIGAQPILATHANAFASRSAVDSTLLRQWERFYPRATGATILEFERLAAERTRRVAADSNVLVVDLRASLSAAPRSAFADYAHFTDSGAALAARVLRDAVLVLASGAHTSCRPPVARQMAAFPAVWEHAGASHQSRPASRAIPQRASPSDRP